MTRKKGDFAIGELIPDHRVPRKRTRIQARNEQRILDAAQEVFADYGFHGATIDKVAGKADMSQPNLHHYFKRKSDLYDAVLVPTLAIWLRPLPDLNPDGEPRSEDHTSELQSLLRTSYSVFCLKPKKSRTKQASNTHS